ncbi:hypothetical protein nbrc107696_21570 [Gordonia spumicola]|uniref:Uncharacterized protein n=1 Tax=Gordonia spumicola TaxID=589161 RepID=A0A7I9V9D8_9ACTN|nr:hypothetical protein [Gordonia spumicola]GEE01711.1 hypothetical protein nbrc107696_21570 [Gordonia spumicola]
MMTVRRLLPILVAGCAAVLVVIPGTAAAAPGCSGSVSALRTTCSQASIDRLFRTTDAGPIPMGVYRGQARPMGGPNTGASSAIGSVWAGKHFYRGWLTNRVFGGEALPANVYYGRSAIDGRRVIRIDYARSGLGGLHDEIRRLGNGVYLGYGFDGPRRIVTFWVWR